MSTIQIICDDGDIVVLADDYAYRVAVDDQESDFTVLITSPDGIAYETGWTFSSYDQTMSAIMKEAAERQALPRLEDVFFNCVRNSDTRKGCSSDGEAERQILSHTRTATARAALLRDMTATAMEEYLASRTI